MLRAYQNKAADFIYEHNEAALFLEMGAGKTAIMVTALCDLLEDRHIARVLVVAPKRVCKHVWPNEIKLWGDNMWNAVALGTAKQRVAAINSDALIVIINYENLVWLFDNNLHKSFDCIVFDELTKMKNSSSARFKSFIKNSRGFVYRYGMTGTPTSQGLIDLYAQMRCIDGGAALGRTKTWFMNTYYTKHGINEWDWRIRPGALDTAMDCVTDVVFTIPPDDYASQLPPLHVNNVYVDLPHNIRTSYDELEDEYILALDDGDTKVVPNAGAMVNSLQQIADGFLYHGDRTTDLHTAKLDALGEIIDSYQGQPLIVVYKYKHELAQMLERWPGEVLGGNVSEAAADAAIFKWNCGQVPLLYLQPQSAGHGLNLQAGGSVMVWFGHTWSLEDHDQTVARLRRSGQTSDKVVAHYIIARDTVDEQIIDARLSKGNTLAAVRAGVLSRQQRREQ